MAQFNVLMRDYLQSAPLYWHPVCLITLQAVKLLVRNTREKVKRSSWLSKSIKITAALALAAAAIGSADSAKAVSFFSIRVVRLFRGHSPHKPSVTSVTSVVLILLFVYIRG